MIPMAEAVLVSDETQLELMVDGGGEIPSAQATEICSGSALSTPLHRRCCYRGSRDGPPLAPHRRGRCGTMGHNDWAMGAAVSVLATLVLVGCVYTIEYRVNCGFL